MGSSPYGGAPRPSNDTPKILGIASLVSGIIAIPASCCCWFLGWIPALVAIVTGIASLVQAKDDPGSDVKPFAIAGIVLGALGLVLVAVGMVWLIASGGSTWDNY